MRRRYRFWLAALLSLLVLAAAGATALVWRPSIAPIEPPDPKSFDSAEVARGEQLARLGDCATCHGESFAGGRGLPTPFGIIHVSNISPDAETGIGRWPLDAFVRAMRHGIARDGSHLYPAFPYNDFTRTSDADLKALYAYLMTRPAVAAATPPNRLPFPLNWRAMVAGWNLLYLRPGAFERDPAKSANWNRGAYLATGLGHCSACHSPRDALGGEENGGDRALTGGSAEGWRAPDLTGASHDPVPWTVEDLQQYLATGYSPFHGAAAGPMRPVVADGLSHLPPADLHALAVYLMSFSSAAPAEPVKARLEKTVMEAGYGASRQGDDAGGQIFAGACAACHHNGGPMPFGATLPLLMSSALHQPVPDNLVRIIMGGVRTSAPPGPAAQLPDPQPGFMPGFAATLDDKETAALVRYLRDRYSKGHPWEHVESAVAAARKAYGGNGEPAKSAKAQPGKAQPGKAQPGKAQPGKESK